MASTTLDLPEPLGPTTQVMPGSNFNVVVDAKDLKPFNVRLFRCTGLRKVVTDGYSLTVGIQRRSPRTVPTIGYPPGEVTSPLCHAAQAYGERHLGEGTRDSGIGDQEPRLLSVFSQRARVDDALAKA